MELGRTMPERARGLFVDDVGEDLSNTVAVVTGAGRGLGRHFALALADWGATVAVVGRTPASLAETVRLINDAGGRAVGLHADVAEDGSAVRVLDRVEATLGPVDVLINNAGTMNLGQIAVIDPAAWWTDFEVNVKATMEWCQAALASMNPRGAGVIVNIASSAAQWVVPAGSAYIASKAAVIAMTQVLAAELKGTGVRAISFGPWARTAMTDGLATSPALTARQRSMFSPPDDVEAARRLAGSIQMLRQILAGDLDKHLGTFLDSEAPPT